VPNKPGNIYGDRHPVEILKDPTGRKGRQSVQESAPRPIKNIPGPSRQISDTPQLESESESEDDPLAIPHISLTQSELDIKRDLNRSDPEAERGSHTPFLPH
jgi:hypothetical protein